MRYAILAVLLLAIPCAAYADLEIDSASGSSVAFDRDVYPVPFGEPRDFIPLSDLQAEEDAARDVHNKLMLHEDLLYEIYYAIEGLFEPQEIAGMLTGDMRSLFADVRGNAGDDWDEILDRLEDATEEVEDEMYSMRDLSIIIIDRSRAEADLHHVEKIGYDPFGQSYFPVHSTGFGDNGAVAYIPNGDLTIRVRVTDADYILAAGRDVIIGDGDGPVTIFVNRGYDTCILATAGSADPGPVTDYGGCNGEYIRYGPIQETAPDAGVFELDIIVRYNDGPTDQRCPTRGEGCVLQGDTIRVEYTGAAVDGNPVTDSATFYLRDAVLQSDKNSYPIGTDMTLTLVEPDFDLDGDRAETYTLDLVEWGSDAAIITMGSRGGAVDSFDPKPEAFRETGGNTGIFQTIIKIPEEIGGYRLEGNEIITLEYTDWGPAGAYYVGDEASDVVLEIMTSDFATAGNGGTALETITPDFGAATGLDRAHLDIKPTNQVYSVGQSLVVLGRAGPGENIIIWMTGPDGAIANLDQITTNLDGSFQHTILVWPEATASFPYGTYAVQALSTQQGILRTVDVRFAPAAGAPDGRPHTGMVAFDSDTYNIFDTVTITLEDADLNADPNAIDTYAIGETAGLAGGGGTILLDVTIDGSPWSSRHADPHCLWILESVTADTGLDTAGFALAESDTDSGVFAGSFQVPSDWCRPGGELPETTVNLELGVHYQDPRGASGGTIGVGDSAALTANTGSVAFDRVVYPAPFGRPGAAAGAYDGAHPDGESYFPIHPAGFGPYGEEPAYVPNGDLTVYVRVTDPDYNTSASTLDEIAEEGAGPVTISVIRGYVEHILATAGGTEYEPYGNSYHMFGPMREAEPDAGVFEAEIIIRYDDGPEDLECPAGGGCMLPGDILRVEYLDDADALGDRHVVVDTAVLDLRTAVLQSDRAAYGIGDGMVLTLIEPDFDLDGGRAEAYSLDLIGWDSYAATLTLGPRGGSMAAFEPVDAALRETGYSTGIFQTLIEMPEELNGRMLRMGEAITLEYMDWGPAGARYVGEYDESVALEVATSDLGATVELDRDAYTWTDRVYITVVAPGYNFNDNLIDEIGTTREDAIRISTTDHKLYGYRLVETGADTGIFAGEVTLAGFAPHDADGDGVAYDARSTTHGVGPADGYLQAGRNDDLTVSFRYDDGNPVVASAPIRWNIGEVQWLEPSYPATGAGVVRVMDPDMNLNPEAVDIFGIGVWSDSDVDGIVVAMLETDVSTGIFEGIVAFQPDPSMHGLGVDEGNMVTAGYVDRTLPEPYGAADDLYVTASTLIGAAVSPMERVPATNLRVVDSFGSDLDTVPVHQPVRITADLVNNQDGIQEFAYVVQVQDADGDVVSRATFAGSLMPGQSLRPTGFWTPVVAGTYTVTASVWESPDGMVPLSPPATTTIRVE